MVELLEQELAGQTIVAEYAHRAAAATTDAMGGNFFHSRTSPIEAFYQVGGGKIVNDLTPLAGVGPDGEILIEHPALKLFALRQIKPKVHNYGLVKGAKGMLTHATAIEAMEKSFIGSDGAALQVDSIVISGDGSQMIVQFPIETIDVHGDEVQQSMVAYTSVKRSKGAGVVLWSLPIRCTNQIPVMRMGGKDGWQTGSAPRIRFEDLLDKAAGFYKNAPILMREMYEGMAAYKLKSSDFGNLLSALYPTPALPPAKLTDTGMDSIERWKKHRFEVESVEARRNMVMEILENANGTHDTKAMREYSLYSYLQAVSELETKSPYKSFENVAHQLVGGTGIRQKAISKAFEQCLTMVKRKDGPLPTIAKSIRPYKK